jgi:hypothetical protein
MAVLLVWENELIGKLRNIFCVISQTYGMESQFNRPGVATNTDAAITFADANGRET